MSEERAPDPLTAFIGRSLRADVSEVSEEILQDTTEAEIDRVSFVQEGRRRSLIVKRLPPPASLEVRLLPHLARKSDRVPAVYARGIPPLAVPAWPWLLIEDLVDAPRLEDLEAIVAAKVAVERAVQGDGPALAALGVPRMARRGPLAAWPEVIVHGALTRSHAVRTQRGAVLIEWGHASLGCGLLDVVRLARDAGVERRPLAALYGQASGQAIDDAAIAAAEDLL